MTCATKSTIEHTPHRTYLQYNKYISLAHDLGSARTEHFCTVGQAVAKADELQNTGGATEEIA